MSNLPNDDAPPPSLVVSDLPALSPLMAEQSVIKHEDKPVTETPPPPPPHVPRWKHLAYQIAAAALVLTIGTAVIRLLKDDFSWHLIADAAIFVVDTAAAFVAAAEASFQSGPFNWKWKEADVPDSIAGVTLVIGVIAAILHFLVL